MDSKNPLHLGALLCAAAAFFWGLSAFTAIAFPLAFLAGLAAGILLLFTRGLEDRPKILLRWTAVLLVAVHAFFIVLFAITTPVNIGEEPDQGFNLDPPAWGLVLRDVYGTLLVLLSAILLPAAIVPLAHSRERILAGIGILVVAAVVLISLVGTTAGPEALGVLSRVLFMLGFFAIAAATLLPPVTADDPPWRRTTRATGSSAP